MLELLADPNVWIAFLTLTVMEIVLGIDNIVFISVLVSRLPREQAEFARKLGIGLALVFRIVLLLLISVIVQLKEPTDEAKLAALVELKDLSSLASADFITRSLKESEAAEKPALVKFANRMLRCTSGFCNLDAAAGLYVDADTQTLSVYATAGWLDDDRMKLTVYGGRRAAAR